MTLPRTAIIGGIAMLAGLAGLQAAGQGTAAERAAREKAMIAAEHRLVEAVAKSDVATIKAMTAAEAWSISGRGAMSLPDFLASLKDFKIEPGWTISDTRVVWAAGNTAILFYTLTGKATFMGKPLPATVFASTVWHEEKNQWIAYFHQETPAISAQR